MKLLCAKLYSCFLSWLVKLAGDVFFFQTVISCGQGEGCYMEYVAKMFSIHAIVTYSSY